MCPWIRITAHVCGLDGRAHSGMCLCRLRKDPLDTIDGGTKVKLAFQRITDPNRAAKEEKARKQAVAAAAKAAEQPKKAGAWGGLPSRG